MVSSRKMTQTRHTDIRNDGWVDKMPPAIIPYLKLGRFDRLIGVWLTLLPAFWAVTWGADGFYLKHISIYVLFFLGAILIRGAGCVINDLWDRELDKSVERTAVRPLASGALVPRQAFALLFFLLSAAFAVLVQFPLKAIFVGCFAIIPIVIYPLMKRVTYWPQLFLGITFNLGVLIGWFTVRPELTATPVLLYLGGLCWTMVYDTVYGHQDMKDDLKIGIKSTAIRFGKHSKTWVATFFAVSIVLLAAAFYPQWYVIVPAALHAAWQMKTWNPQDPVSCLKIFKANAVYGTLLWASLIMAGAAAL